MRTLAALVIAFVVSAAIGNDDPKTTENEVHPQQYENCGHVAFYLVCQLKDLAVDWQSASEWVGPPDRNGLSSFADLERAAKQAGLTAIGIEAGWDDLQRMPVPSIVQTRSTSGKRVMHLSVLTKVASNGVTLVDAPQGPRFVHRNVFLQIWTGNLLLFFSSEHEAMEYAGRVAAGHRVNSTNRALFVSARVLLIAVVATVIFGIVRRFADPLSRMIEGVLRFRSALGQSRTVASTIIVTSLIVIALGCWIGLTASAGPHMTLTNVVDLGTLDSGPQKSTIEVRNTGNQPLQIAKIQTTCKCVSAGLPDVVAPGEIAKIPLTIHASPGSMQVDVIVHSNDTRGPQRTRLQFAGAMQPVFFPGQLYFDVDGMGQASTQRITLYYSGKNDSPPEVRMANKVGGEIVEMQSNVNLPNTSSEYTPSAYIHERMAAAYFDAKLKSAHAFAPQRLTQKLSLHDGKRQFEYELPVVVQTRESLTLQPRAVFVSGQASESPSAFQEREMRISDSGGIDDFVIRQTPKWCDSKLIQSANGDIVIRLRVTEFPAERVRSDRLIVARRDRPADIASGTICYVRNP